MLTASLVLAALPEKSFAGGEGSGGGDASERRVNEIRADILKWITEGGASRLRLPSRISYENYRSAMSLYLQPLFVVVGFVSTEQERKTKDPELKVVVDGQPKTCRCFSSSKDHRPHILCNIERFAATGEADQYRLIHHEYAGLASVELNNGAASDYEISDQLSDYLRPETILRLFVKPAEAPPKRVFTTVTGAVFSFVSDDTAIGEAWSDPNGLIWGSVMKREHFGEANGAGITMMQLISANASKPVFQLGQS